LARQVGEPLGVRRDRSRSVAADVQVDQHVAHSAFRGGVDRRVGVDGDL
jgi:hypothetical protein